MRATLQERLDVVYAIGGGVGANRPAYTAAEDDAHALVSGWMADAGLVVERDPAGNLIGRLLGRRPELPEVWTGSHLDSVPHGGRFDGPLGVLGGLEALVRAGRQERTLAVVAFRDEEGWRFGRGCFGSRALCGQVEPGELDTVDADGVTLRDALGAAPPPDGWLSPLAAYVELHIEQGPVLAGLDAPLGVVTSIVGLARLEVVFEGRAGHAGTTPMRGRDDALCKAAAFTLAVRDAAERLCVSDTRARVAVATVGRLSVEPNAANVIPARVALVVDARAPEEETLAALVEAIVDAAADGEVRLLRRTRPVAMAPLVQEALAASLAELGFPAPELHSGAGHDAGPLGSAGIAAGMLFVRSRNGGVSHSPDEWSDADDVELGVEVLAATLTRLGSAV